VNPDRARRFIGTGDIAVTVKAGRLEVVKKSYMPQGKKPKTLWKDPKYLATTHGTKLLIDIIGKQLFSHPKSLYLVIDCLRFWSDEEANVLDFFAGSGTTGHAVIALNREDASAGSAHAAGRRKFILVEMADYFDTVLLPRIKKVTFTPEWKDGKPKRMAAAEEAERSPRIVKVIRLESYGDALNNLTFDEQGGQLALGLFRDDYLLSYMLKWETRHSQTLLNIEKLQLPFSYKLHIHRDGETRERTVDLPETFNYLLGLDVQTRRVYDIKGKRYLFYRGTLRNGRTVVAIWRETMGWTEEDYRRERDFVKEQKLAEGADEIYTDGDSFIPGARSLDGLFKTRMFAAVEA
jgi:adenine-specific DNA-methyltransferase